MQESMMQGLKAFESFLRFFFYTVIIIYCSISTYREWVKDRVNAGFGWVVAGVAITIIYYKLLK